MIHKADMTDEAVRFVPALMLEAVLRHAGPAGGLVAEDALVLRKQLDEWLTEAGMGIGVWDFVVADAAATEQSDRLEQRARSRT